MIDEFTVTILKMAGVGITLIVLQFLGDVALFAWRQRWRP